MIEDRLAKIKERRAKVTPGKWAWVYDRRGYCRGLFSDTGTPLLHLQDVYEGFPECGEELRVEPLSGDDAAFIASAPDDIDWLVERVEALEAFALEVRDGSWSIDYICNMAERLLSTKKADP